MGHPDLVCPGMTQLVYPLKAYNQVQKEHDIPKPNAFLVSLDWKFWIHKAESNQLSMI
jgi:hypothetical protein